MLRLRRQEPTAGVGADAVVVVVVVVARQQADRATEAELALRQHQQRRAGWLEANPHLGPAYRHVMRELAWQRRATAWPPNTSGPATSVRSPGRYQRPRSP
jgi:hypothetical protein